MATQKQCFTNWKNSIHQANMTVPGLMENMVENLGELENATGGGGSGSEVEVTQIQTTGTKIATITVDGAGTDLYAPKPSYESSITVSVSASKDATSITVTDLSIKAGSLITPFSQNTSGSVVAIKTCNATTGSATLTFDALEEATSFKLLVINEGE